MNNFFNDVTKTVKPEIAENKSNPFSELSTITENTNNSNQYNSTNILDLISIKQTYDSGKVVVFDNLNLSIKDITDRGQFVTILGQSGCGKSTILRYIAGIQTPTEGKLMLKGKELNEDDRIPMVFQHYSSFPWFKVIDNISLPLILKGVSKKEAYDRAMEMVKVVGLEGHENKYAKYPLLSGGQLQRVAIARNLVANSEILLMDEPFGALDIVTRRSMQSFLRKIFQDNNNVDPTIILVTHDIREAIFLSTDIFILDINPANIRCHIEIDLPFVRDIHLKRESKFLEYVNYIEDFMEKLEKETESKKQQNNNIVKQNKKSIFNFLIKNK